jgi:hypothetical protein
MENRFAKDKLHRPHYLRDIGVLSGPRLGAARTVRQL